MALKAKLYTFLKNPNSTKRPVDIENLQYTIDNVTLNSPTDLLHPVITVNPDPAVAPFPTGCNYMHLDTIGKYYFIDRWSWENGVWNAHCSIDVLATHKYDIGQQRAYIARSSSAYDGTITDSTYAIKNDAVLELAPSTATQFTSVFAEGTYVIGVINNSTSSVGAVTYYALTNSQFRALSAYMLDSVDWLYGDITDISEELFKNLANPMQYIASCMWFPFYKNFMVENGEDVTEIPYGYWSLPNILATRITEFAFDFSVSFDVPKHPQSATRGDYLNHAPYSKYWITWPLIGTLGLDQDIVADADLIGGQIYVDIVTGKGVWNVVTEESKPFYSMEIQCAVPVSLSQTSYNGIFGGAASSLTSYLGTAYRDMSESKGVLGKVGAIAGTIFTGLSNALGAGGPVITSTASTGSTRSFAGVPVLNAMFYPIAEEDNARLGRPLCQSRVISSIPGFIMTADSKVVILGTYDEQQMVRDLMDGGFYYE